MSVFLQELFHVPDILESIQKLIHALKLRLDQGMENVCGDQFQVLELYSFHGAYILYARHKSMTFHVFAKVEKVFCKTGHN
jgi:hypothetical protein